MKILFDQGTPVPLRRSLPGHEVDTAYELGWQELENGELIAAAEREAYEILITTDQNLALSAESRWSKPRCHRTFVNFLAAHSAARRNDPGCDRSDAPRFI